MNASTRNALRQLEEGRRVRGELLDGNHQSTRQRWSIGTPLRTYRWWQRAVSALVAFTLFAGPLSVSFEQSRDAAGVLAAGSRRLDDDAWQRIIDLAAVRVRLSMQKAQATPIVDPNAPISFQPKITQTTGAGGGVPVVNITAPNAAGISLNQYQSFNIDPIGLILNNSLMSGTSLTGGDVQANPNLSGRTASIILNQVTSTGAAYASLLNGPLEVFGAPATVIIANPNGITTRGTGFTNTIGVTLSTGTPQFLSDLNGTRSDFASAQAVGYSVTGGHIQIEGDAGANGPGAGIEGTVGTIDLIAETIGVNAPLYAGTRINAVAGRQFVLPSSVTDSGTTYATSANGSTNTAAAINAGNGSANNGLAIDGTAFGAMTAGTIQVIGTAAGMGVRTDAQLAANAGDLLLSANGDVSVAGSAAQQQATVLSGGNVSMTGTHIGIGGYTINANGDVTSTGTIQSGGKLGVTAGGNVNIANAQSSSDMAIAGGSNVTLGDVQSGAALTATAHGNDGAGDVNLNGTAVVTGATTVQAARDVNVNGQTNSGTLQATGQRNVNVNAALQTSGDLALSATSGNLTTSANVKGGGNLALTSGKTTTIAAQTTAQDAVTLTAGQDFTVSGSLASGTTLVANVTRDISVAGSLLVGTNAQVAAGRNLDVPGVVIVQQDGVFSAQADLTGSGSLAFGQSGSLTTGLDVAFSGKLLANNLQVNAGNNASLADVQAGGAFNVVANGITGNAGGGGDVTFNGNAAAVGATNVQAARDVIVNGTLAGGSTVTLAAQRNVTVASSGAVQAVGDLTIGAATGSVTSTGTLNGAAGLIVNGAQDVALTGSTSVVGDTNLTAGHDLTIGGTLAGQGGATLTAGHDVIAGSSSGFVKDATVSATNNLSVTGALQGAAVSLTAGQSVTLANVQANAALQVVAIDGQVTVNGTVSSLSTASLTAASDIAVNGTLQTAATLGVTSGGNTSIAGTVQSNGDVNLQNAAGSLTSTGNIQSGGNLVVNAAQSVDLGTQGTSALGDLTVNAGQNLTMNGSVVAQGNGTLTAGGTIAGAAAAAFGLAANVSSGGDTNLTGSLRGATVQTTAGGSATLHDVQAGSTVALAAAGDLNVTGAVTGGSTVVLNAGQNINVSGSIQSTSDTTLTSTNGSVGSTGTIASNGAFNVQAGTDVNLGGTTTAAFDTTLNAARDVNVTGMLTGQGQGIVTAGRDISGAGTLSFAQAATLSAGRDVTQGGLIQGQSVQVTAAGNAAVNNVESASTIALVANGTNTATGPGNLTVNGSVASAGAVTATAQNSVSVAGKVASGSTVGITAQQDIAIAGAVESVGDTVLTAQQGSLNATGGINSGGKLDVTTGLDLSLGTSTSAVGDATLTAGRDAMLNGTFVGQANGIVNAGRDITGAGTQAFTQAATYTAQRDISLTGGVQANVVNAVGSDSAALNNVTSATTLTVTANGNAGAGDAAITGTATAPGVVTLNAARDVLVSGSLTSADTLTLAAQRNVSVSGTAQTTAGDLTATASTGSIALTGTTTASGALNLTSGLDTQLGGTIASANTVTVQAGRDIILSGTLAGQQDGSLTAAHDINGGGSAAFAQTATLNAANDLALTGALQGASVTVTGGNNAGLGSVQAVKRNLAVTATGNAGGGDVMFGGTATAFGVLALQAARDVGVTGAINTGGTTTINATRNATLADVNSAGDLSITATNGNANAGNVTTQGNLSATSGQALAFSGQTTVGGNATLTSGGDTTLTGGIAAQNTGTLTAGGSVTAGSVAFGQQATINAGGSIGVTGGVTTNGNLAASAGDDLSLGSAQAGGTVALQALGHNGAGDVSVGGVLASGGATTVTAARDATLSGDASRADAFTATAGRNLKATGAIGANSGVVLTATTGNLAVGGSITSVGNLNATAGGTLVLAGELVNGDTTLSSGGTATLTGAFYGLGAGTINAGGSIIGGGALTFGKDIAINAGGVLTLGGIQGAGALNATSNGDMSLGATTAVGNVTATSKAGSVTFGGDLQSGGNVQIQAANNASVTGAVSSMGSVNITGTNGNVGVAGVSSNGDTTIAAGQTLTLSGTSTVAGQFALTGGNVTLSGSQGGSKNVTVSAQGTVDATQASLVSTQNMQVSGAKVTLGTAIVGGALTAQASNQLSLVGSSVDVVGAATLTSQNGFYNASNVLSGGALYVSAPNLTNAANASLASTGTTTINASSFTNAGLVNGATTNVTVGGGLSNVGGSLMGVNALNINTGTLNNQNGIIFAGNPDSANGPTTGDVSLTINGGDGSFNNAGGQLLAQRNLGFSAVNMAFDPSQGTISQGGQLSITAASINSSGTWNYGGQGVTLDGLYGITNSGTISGTAPLTLTTGGTFTNYGQVTGNDVTFNGTLNNVAGAVMHADDVLAINGNTTNRGTVEAGNALNVSGGSYDNQGALTQSAGDISFTLSGNLQNTGGTITAGRNLSVSANAVINDQTAPTGTVTTTTAVDDPNFLWSGVVGTQTSYTSVSGARNQTIRSTKTTLTVGGLLSPDGQTAQLNPVAGSGDVTFRQIWVPAPTKNDPLFETRAWVIEDSSNSTLQSGLSATTIVLPQVYETSTVAQVGTAGVMSAGGDVSISASSLSNQGGQIGAGHNLNLQISSLQNGPVASTVTSSVTEFINQDQYSSFLSQLAGLGPLVVSGTGNPSGTQSNCGRSGGTCATTVVPMTSYAIQQQTAAPSLTSTITDAGAFGVLAAGNNIGISTPGTLVNGGTIYAGQDIVLSAGASLQNQGGNQQTYSTAAGCAQGVSNASCTHYAETRGNNPTTTTFGYQQSDATIYAGHDLVISAGQIDNTYGNLLAGHDIVIGGVGTTASSTTPAQSLNNTSGNIVAGDNITLNVSGAITNSLPPPVPVHQNYGSKEQYSGCMTAGGYKESYCEGYVDQQSGSSSVISAGNNLQINAGSLTNIGSLIAAGNTATIAVAGPVVNEAQTLNTYWHSHWVQETGDFSPDKRHDTWACGSAAECTALYGSAYTGTSGTIDPPQPVGNIAATIQAPNLSITSGGQIQNVGNVIGTSVSLTGQKLINGITTANTYTPKVNAPSQVISLSPVDLPGLNLSTPRAVGTGSLPTPVAGTASYVDNSLGGSAIGAFSPQDLLNNLPSRLQPSSTLFYYNPQEEDLLLQQAALQQTGQASFISGLTYDSKNGLSVTEQEKAILYQNALQYAETNNLQLGDALTQTQINALDKPMLWYVEQTVPDPTCRATGTATCPTITALMPQVYLPQDTSAMSAGGNITGQNVTLDFNKDGGGSILNTGSITASGTLTLNTGTLTNQANQVNVGAIWSSVKGGYVDTTGTTVQPGGFMSAANMDLNVQTLNQIGGALQKLNADGTVDQAGTQQLLATLQQQLGGNLTQTSVSDDLHTSFTAEGGFGIQQIAEMVAAVAASIVTAGAAAAALGATMATLTLGQAVMVAAVSAMSGSLASQVVAGNGINAGAILEAGAVGALTAGLTDGITYNSTSGSFGLGNWDQGLNSLPQDTSTLGQLAGISNVGNALTGTVSTAGETAANNLPEEIAAMGATATISAGVQTAIEGGSFLDNLKTAGISDAAAVGAFAIGNLNAQNFFGTGAQGELGYVAAHAVLGCAASAAEGTGCASGAIGGAASAAINPVIDGNGNIPPALLAAITTAVGGGIAGALGYDAQGAATAAQNETLNNWLNHVPPSQMYLSEQQQYDNDVAACNGGKGDATACQKVQDFNALSQERDVTLNGACKNGGSQACTDQTDAALEAGNGVVSVATTNGYVTFANSPGVPTITALPDSFQSVFGPSFDGQAATSTSQALSMSPLDGPFSLGGLISEVRGLLGIGDSAGVLGAAVGESASAGAQSTSGLAETAGSSGSTEVISSAVQGPDVSVTSVSVTDTPATGVPANSGAGGLASGRTSTVGGGFGTAANDASFNLPQGYTPQADGTVLGPRGATYTATGSTDLEGNQIYQSGSGGYYTLAESGAAPSVAPSTLAGQSPGSIVQANNAAHTIATEAAATDFTSQGLKVQPNVTMTTSIGGCTTVCVADQVIVAPAGTTSAQVPKGFAAYDVNNSPLLDGNGNPATVLPLNSQGQAVIEIKTGNGQYTTGQTTVYPAVQSGNAIGIGGNAGKAGVSGPISSTPVYVLRPI